MTAVTLPLEPGTDLVSDEPPILEVSEILDDPQSRKKHKKKSKECRKRSRSCSTDASCCSSASKRKRKKKKHHRRSLDEPPSHRVNPIFLWVKEDNAKIVEVRCEDYDRRNRIKLTKTAGGWRATPHVETTQWESEPKFEPGLIKTELPAPKLEPELMVKCENEYMSDNEIPPPKLEMCEVDDRQICRNDDDRQMPPLERQIDFNDSAVTFADSDDDDEEEMAKIAQEAAEREQEIADRERELAEKEEAERKMADQQDEVENIVEMDEPQADVEVNCVQGDGPMSGTQAHDEVNDEQSGVEPTADATVEMVTQLDDSEINERQDDSQPIDEHQIAAVRECPDSLARTPEHTADSIHDLPVEHADETESFSIVENTLEEAGLETGIASQPKLEPADCNIDKPLAVDEDGSLNNCEGSSSVCKNLDNSPQEAASCENSPPAVPIEQASEVESVPNEEHIAEIVPEHIDSECKPATLQESISLDNAEFNHNQLESAESDKTPESPRSTVGEEKPECSMKCCDESNAVDENHNNEFDSDPRSSCMIEPSNFVQDVEEILGAIENPPNRAETGERAPQKDVDEYDHSALMTELEEMMNERMKQEGHKDVLDDIYNFVPSPSHSADVSKTKAKDRPTSKIERVIEAVKAKSCLMAKANEEKPKESTKLKGCDLESLDLLWRLPEGTTIHHSKPFEKEDNQLPACTTATISLVPPPVVTTAPSVSQPMQEEPLNLGKPRRESPSVSQAQLVPPPQTLKKETAPCKIEAKPSLPLPMPVQHSDTKTSTKFTPELAKTMEPLAQLKEIMSDPEVSVPDPLLVPKERLSALIANPKKEIPRLMALANEVKYPKLDTNLMEVSLAHLQLLLQSSKKEDELKLIQKHADILQSHLKKDASSLDPATMSALNQMLWFPYLSHLDMGRSSNPQDIMGMMNMMYPYNAWGQQSYDYAQQSHLMNFWQDMQKPSLGQNSHTTKGFGDLYKSVPPTGQSLYTSAPSLGHGRVATAAASYQPRQHKHSRRHHSRQSHLAMTPDFLKPPVTPDFLKASATPDFLKGSVTPDFLKASSTPDFLKSSVTSDFLKNPVTPDFLKSSVTPDFLKSSVTPDFLKAPFDMSAWTLPQTSEASRTSQRHSSRPPVTEPSQTLSASIASSGPEPKLKVRKFDVDPNAVPKLINKNLTAPTLPPLAAMSRQVPSHYYDSNHLWNPLYGSVEPREPDYSSSGHWNWTTPVTVSGK